MLIFFRKTFYLLSTSRLKLLVLLTIYVLVSALEGLGIWIILPFITLASQPQKITEITWLNRIYQQTGLASPSSFIALSGVLVITVFCAKALMSWWVQTSAFTFGYRAQAILTDRLMRAYLLAPYTFHIERNSAEIQQNVITETRRFSNGVLIPLLQVASNLFITASLGVMLCITNLLAIVVIFGTGLPLFLLFGSIKNRLSLWGKRISQTETEILRSVNHSLGGIKESKVIGCEAYFYEKISAEADTYAKTLSKFFAYTLAPRSIVEALLIIFLVGAVSIFLTLGENIQTLLPILSVFALASIRMIPALTNLLGSMSTLKSSTFTIDKLYAELTDLENLSKQSTLALMSSLQKNKQMARESEFLFKEQIELKDLTYKYPNAADNALASISLTIEKNQSVAFIGKSGAGKTTLVDVILGLLQPQSGDIQVDGRSIYNSLRNWQDLVGYIPQSIYLIDDTIQRNIAFGVPDHLIDHGRLSEAIQAAQLTELIQSLSKGIDTAVGERGVLLSGGQRQRIGIARALYHGREVLVLDEATSALDNETESLVTESIQALSGQKTMIIIAHRLTTIQHCDQVYVMGKGHIAESGSYQDIVLPKQALA